MSLVQYLRDRKIELVYTEIELSTRIKLKLLFW